MRQHRQVAYPNNPPLVTTKSLGSPSLPKLGKIRDISNPTPNTPSRQATNSRTTAKPNKTNPESRKKARPTLQAIIPQKRTMEATVQRTHCTEGKKQKNVKAAGCRGASQIRGVQARTLGKASRKVLKSAP